MYGEDIDLSYRIINQGMKNVYVPTTIVHYKGESTKKGDMKYLKAFYESMLLFYKKHYAGSFPLWFYPISGLIHEQDLYLHKMLEYMGYDKILGGVMGSHEKWSRRTGLDSYKDIRKNIPIFDGTGTVNRAIRAIERRKVEA